MQRNGYRAQYVYGSDGDFVEQFDVVLRTGIDLTTDTTILSIAYDRTGLYVFDGYLFVRDSVTESFGMTVGFLLSDVTGAAVQFVVDAPVAANAAAGDVFVQNVPTVGGIGTSNTITLSSTANLARVVRVCGSFTVSIATPGTFAIRGSKVSGAGTISARLGSRLRGSRVPG